MKNFMTALPVILVQLTCPGDQRPKGSQFQLTCNLCRESHKTQVWLCFLVLRSITLKASKPPQQCGNMPTTKLTVEHGFCLRLVADFLSTSTCSAFRFDDLKTCVERVRPKIEKSDAMLYAPSVSDIEEKCRMRTLECYMSELKMVMREENVLGPGRDFILEASKSVSDRLLKADQVSCLPCEAYPLENITEFLKRLDDLLGERMSNR